MTTAAPGTFREPDGSTRLSLKLFAQKVGWQLPRLQGRITKALAELSGHDQEDRRHKRCDLAEVLTRRHDHAAAEIKAKWPPAIRLLIDSIELRRQSGMPVMTAPAAIVEDFKRFFAVARKPGRATQYELQSMLGAKFEVAECLAIWNELGWLQPEQEMVETRTPATIRGKHVQRTVTHELATYDQARFLELWQREKTVKAAVTELRCLLPNVGDRMPTQRLQAAMRKLGFVGVRLLAAMQQATVVSRLPKGGLRPRQGGDGWISERVDPKSISKQNRTKALAADGWLEDQLRKKGPLHHTVLRPLAEQNGIGKAALAGAINRLEVESRGNVRAGKAKFFCLRGQNPLDVKAASLKARSPRKQASHSPANGQRIKKIDAALLILAEHPELSDREIARRAGCTHPALVNSKRFQRLREAHAKRLPRGSKSRHGIEAEDAED